MKEEMGHAEYALKGSDKSTKISQDQARHHTQVSKFNSFKGGFNAFIRRRKEFLG